MRNFLLLLLAVTVCSYAEEDYSLIGIGETPAKKIKKSRKPTYTFEETELLENPYHLIGIGKKRTTPRRRSSSSRITRITVTDERDKEYGLIGLGEYDYKPKAKKRAAKNPDPFEKFNRRIFKFNEKLDRKILKPLAKLYRKAVPKKVRGGIRRVFSNLNDVFVVANDILQFKPKQAARDTARLTVNTVLGVFGIFDVARHMGLEKHNEDFGQTLGRWGVKPGPYIVVPILGPTTARDLFGTGVHFAAGNKTKVEGAYILSPKKHLRSTAARWAVTGLEGIDIRESLLDVEQTLDTIAIDRYATIRDTYLYRRKYLISDGKIPEEFEEDDEDSLSADEKLDELLEEDDELLDPDDELAGLDDLEEELEEELDEESEKKLEEGLEKDLDEELEEEPEIKLEQEQLEEEKN